MTASANDQHRESRDAAEPNLDGTFFNFADLAAWFFTKHGTQHGVKVCISQRKVVLVWARD